MLRIILSVGLGLISNQAFSMTPEKRTQDTQIRRLERCVLGHIRTFLVEEGTALANEYLRRGDSHQAYEIANHAYGRWLEDQRANPQELPQALRNLLSDQVTRTLQYEQSPWGRRYHAQGPYRTTQALMPGFEARAKVLRSRNVIARQSNGALRLLREGTLTALDGKEGVIARVIPGGSFPRLSADLGTRCFAIDEPIAEDALPVTTLRDEMGHPQHRIEHTAMVGLLEVREGELWAAQGILDGKRQPEGSDLALHFLSSSGDVLGSYPVEREMVARVFSEKLEDGILVQFTASQVQDPYVVSHDRLAMVTPQGDELWSQSFPERVREVQVLNPSTVLRVHESEGVVSAFVLDGKTGNQIHALEPFSFGSMRPPRQIFIGLKKGSALAARVGPKRFVFHSAQFQVRNDHELDWILNPNSVVMGSSAEGDALIIRDQSIYTQQVFSFDGLPLTPPLTAVVGERIEETILPEEGVTTLLPIRATGFVISDLTNLFFYSPRGDLVKTVSGTSLDSDIQRAVWIRDDLLAVIEASDNQDATHTGSRSRWFNARGDELSPQSREHARFLFFVETNEVQGLPLFMPDGSSWVSTGSRELSWIKADLSGAQQTIPLQGRVRGVSSFRNGRLLVELDDGRLQVYQPAPIAGLPGATEAPEVSSEHP